MIAIDISSGSRPRRYSRYEISARYRPGAVESRKLAASRSRLEIVPYVLSCVYLCVIRLWMKWPSSYFWVIAGYWIGFSSLMRRVVKYWSFCGQWSEWYADKEEKVLFLSPHLCTQIFIISEVIQVLEGNSWNIFKNFPDNHLSRFLSRWTKGSQATAHL